MAKVRNGAENAIMAMCGHTAFGVAMCVDAVIRNQVKPTAKEGAKKAMNSNKLIIGKYQILSRILGESQDIPDQQLQSSLTFAGKGMQHAL